RRQAARRHRHRASGQDDDAPRPSLRHRARSRGKAVVRGVRHQQDRHRGPGDLPAHRVSPPPRRSAAAPHGDHQRRSGLVRGLRGRDAGALRSQDQARGRVAAPGASGQLRRRAVPGFALPRAGARALAAASFRKGRPPAPTGGFGAPTCRECHFDAGLDEPGGAVAITGVPGRYAAGRTYDLEVTLRRAGMLRGGFQLAARFADGDRAGRPAGTLAPADGRTAVVWDTTTHVGYIEHTETGTDVTNAAARWTIRCTAPAEPAGAVTFHVAANAANDDDSPLGDFI